MLWTKQGMYIFFLFLFLYTEINNINDRKMHLISWNSLARPKCKGAWFRAKFESLWKPPPPSASKFWKLICQIAHNIKSLICLSVAPSCNFSMLWDPWCNGKLLSKYFNSNRLSYLSVNDFIQNGNWSLPDYIPDFVKGIILDINILVHPTLTLAGSSNPSFKSFTVYFYSHLEDVDWCKFIWHKNYSLRFAYGILIPSNKAGVVIVMREYQCQFSHDTRTQLFQWDSNQVELHAILAIKDLDNAAFFELRPMARKIDDHSSLHSQSYSFSFLLMQMKI
ncbi:hypothetical protein M5K25_001827 [Dendrobium thyrsiflorum]|uniref:Uncharacterized protein n=1 Tax=Dendrobium thyrsiflorum TaxID=117978 RepID=A0ABD0VSW4_DENTH